MLSNAGNQTLRRFGTRPFGELADAANQILPQTIPDSGTAGRLAQLSMLPGAGAIAGGGLGYASGGGEGAASGAMTGASLAALLMAGGTKAGQKSLNTLFFDRPDAVRKLKPLLEQQTGLLGTNVQRAGGMMTIPALMSLYQGQ
jgi:hypothetical protein